VTTGGRPPRPPWSEFKAALDAAGFRPSRRLGQNLLLDENAARAIARDARVPPGELVLEVGPGCGFLSVHLADGGARLLAVEIDRRLASIAARFLAPYPDAELVRADALAGKRALAPEITSRLPRSDSWHLVSNLPYSISGPILALCAGHAHPPASMTVLVQAEVAERLVARPGRREWGPLSVAVQLSHRGSVLRHLPPRLFWPRPKVQSAVVRLERRSDLASLEERTAIRELAARLLQRRRQTTGRVVAELVGDRGRSEALLSDLAIEGRMRTGELDLDQLAALARALAG